MTMESKPDKAADALGYISLDLTARVAGVPLAEVQRVASDFAKGRPREPWFGARLRVRTGQMPERRHGDILISSLPDAFREVLATNQFRFLLAAEQAVPGAELEPADFMLLHRAAQSGVASVDFDRFVIFLCDGRLLVRASRARFESIMDRLFGFGFRDPVLLEVGTDYIDFLDACRRQLGIGDAAYTVMVTEAGAVHGGKATPVLLTGVRFSELLRGMYAARGLPVPALPPRRFMTPAIIAMIDAAVRALGLTAEEHRAVLMAFGGAAQRNCDLDDRGAQRVLSHYISRGYVIP